MLVYDKWIPCGLGVKGSVYQGWVVDWTPTVLQKGPNGGVVNTPLPIKLLSLAPPSRHLDENRKGGCVREERTLPRSQTGQAQPGLSCKATKCSGAGTGDIGVLTAHETSLDSWKCQFNDKRVVWQFAAAFTLPGSHLFTILWEEFNLFILINISVHIVKWHERGCHTS